MIRYCCRKTKDFYIIYRIAHNHLCWTRFGEKKRFLTSNHSGKKWESYTGLQWLGLKVHFFFISALKMFFA